MLDRKARASVFQGRGNELVCGSESRMVCDKVEILERGPVRGSVSLRGRILGRGGLVCDFQTTVALEAGSRTVSFKTELGPVDLPEEPAWERAVRARFRLADRNNHKYFRNTLHVMEETRQKRYSSLYFTRVSTGRFTVDFLNSGSQYYCRGERGALEHVLSVDGKPVGALEYGLAVNVAAPYQESLAWQSRPVVINGIADEECAVRASFFSATPASVLISSVRAKGDRLTVRVAETLGQDAEAVLCVGCRLRWAYHTDFVGKNLERLQVDKGEVSFALRPWQVKQLSLAIVKPGER